MATTPEQRQAQTAVARERSIESRRIAAARRREDEHVGALRLLGYELTPPPR